MRQLCEHHENPAKGVEVFVGGLPATVTESKIHAVFSDCGEIVEIRPIKDQKGNLKGFCFVRFATREAAEKAVKEKTGILLDGKKIGVLPSMEQNTLYFGNLDKGWSANEFEGIVHQVFPDVVSVDLAMPLSSGETQPGRKQRNRGFAFVKFSSHAAAARAYRVGSKQDFTLGHNLHPAVQWAEDGSQIDPTVLAKIKIAFIRNLPMSADENYLKKLFEPFGEIEKVVLLTKGSSPVGFVHFTNRLDLDNAIKELNEKTIQGPNGGPTYKLSVEVARPKDKSKKRMHEDSESKLPNKIPSYLSKNNPSVYSSGHMPMGPPSSAQKVVEYDDPYEAAVVALPASVKERLLRILQLGIGTRSDIDIQSLTSLKELPEPIAISVLDQFMLSGADTKDKGIYLAGLISRHQVEKSGLGQFAGSLSRVADVNKRDLALSSFSSRVCIPVDDSLTPHLGTSLSSFSSRVHLPPTDSFPLSAGLSLARSDDYGFRSSLAFSDHPVLTRASFERTKDFSCSPLQAASTSSASQERSNLSPQVAATVEYQDRLKLSHEQAARAEYHDRLKLSPQLAAAVEYHNRLKLSSQLAARAEYHDGLKLSPKIAAAVEYHDRLKLSPQIAARAEYRDRFRLNTQVTTVEHRPTRPQVRFDPFTGEPYKFDPFTGERILPEDLPRRF